MLVDPESEGYLVTLLNYIHLNPVRAGLVEASAGASVFDYPWSSLPGYYWPGRRPAWLVVEHALAALQWKDTARDREAFIDYMRRLALEEIGGPAGQRTEETLWDGLRASLERGWRGDRGQSENLGK